MGLGTILAGAALFGGLAKGLGGFFQEQEKRTVAQFNQKLAQQNAQIVQENAVITAGLIAKQDAFKQSRLSAAFAGRGVRVDAGSPLTVLLQQVKIDTFNQARFTFNEQLKVRGIQIQAQQFGRQAQAASPFTSLFGGIAGGAFQGASFFSQTTTPTQQPIFQGQ